MPRSRSGTGRDRKRAERTGRFGEAIAALYLVLKGYRLLARRYRTPVGEIDLVAARGPVTAFIEVKTRRSVADFGLALQQVNRQRLSRAAEAWLARHPEAATRDLRFDVIFLAPFRLPRHVMNAFDAR